MIYAGTNFPPSAALPVPVGLLANSLLSRPIFTMPDTDDDFDNLNGSSRDESVSPEGKQTKKSKSSMKGDWGGAATSGAPVLAPNGLPILFQPKDFDIYCERNGSGIVYFFHGPKLGCEIEWLEFTPEDQRIIVHTKDKGDLDLGVRIQWLVRPYVKNAKQIFIVQTKDGKTIDGIEVPIKIREEVKTKA